MALRLAWPSRQCRTPHPDAAPERVSVVPLPEDVRALWNSVEVVAFDALHLQFKLPVPFAPFMDYLSFGILPRHLLEGKTPAEIINDPYNLLPIGSGPYQVVDLQAELGVVERLAGFGIVAGTANIRGTEGPINAVATGLVLSYFEKQRAG